MRHLRILTAALFALTSGAAVAADKSDKEQYVREPMPAGVQVINTELEGPVFADAKGRTLYTWPAQTQRNGNLGEVEGKPECYDIKYRETAGIQIPYPGGLELPNADNRPTCVQHWPPMLASADAKPVGNFSVIDRTDGTKQWAYKEFALYTSHLDRNPGETYGGSDRTGGKDPVSSGAKRKPARPAPILPPKFEVVTMVQGRMLVTDTQAAVYYSDRDTPTKSNCMDVCLVDWSPMFAPDTAAGQGEWSVVQRDDGRRQWAFRGHPLYTYLKDSKPKGYDGSDVAGWHNVFTQRAPIPPHLQVVDTDGGQVLADKNGKTVYFYSCAEDTPDTLFCDDTNSPQDYRLAVCGAGDVAKCLVNFPYVVAEKGEKSHGIAWSIIDIDPQTGRSVAGPNSVRVWAFRNRPIYTFAGDKQQGDIEADGWGTAFGHANGYSAFWIRDFTVEGLGQID